eukprot:767643-Hanusia_phi.AAC.1
MAVATREAGNTEDDGGGRGEGEEQEEIGRENRKDRIAGIFFSDFKFLANYFECSSTLITQGKHAAHTVNFIEIA